MIWVKGFIFYQATVERLCEDRARTREIEDKVMSFFGTVFISQLGLETGPPMSGQLFQHTAFGTLRSPTSLNSQD